MKFDTHLVQNPEVSGLNYHRGALVGWERRASLLEKFGRSCVYCGGINQPFEMDHVLPRSRGGSDSVSNLVLSCHQCNAQKGTKTAPEWGYLEVEATARQPLRDAAAMNAIRYALVDALKPLALPIGTWSGGYTQWNRECFGVLKEHCLDALCVGEMVGITGHGRKHLQIVAQERGSYQRTNVDGSGFPREYLTQHTRIRGFSTRYPVTAMVPVLSRSGKPLKTAGVHVGRVAVRAIGSFRVGAVDGINATYCQVLQRVDGYDYV